MGRLIRYLVRALRIAVGLYLGVIIAMTYRLAGEGLASLKDPPFMLMVYMVPIISLFVAIEFGDKSNGRWPF